MKNDSPHSKDPTIASDKLRVDNGAGALAPRRSGGTPRLPRVVQFADWGDTLWVHPFEIAATHVEILSTAREQLENWGLQKWASALASIAAKANDLNAPRSPVLDDPAQNVFFAHRFLIRVQKPGEAQLLLVGFQACVSGDSAKSWIFEVRIEPQSCDPSSGPGGIPFPVNGLNERAKFRVQACFGRERTLVARHCANDRDPLPAAAQSGLRVDSADGLGAGGAKLSPADLASTRSSQLHYSGILRNDRAPAALYVCFRFGALSALLVGDNAKGFSVTARRALRRGLARRDLEVLSLLAGAPCGVHLADAMRLNYYLETPGVLFRSRDNSEVRTRLANSRLEKHRYDRIVMKHLDEKFAAGDLFWMVPTILSLKRVYDKYSCKFVDVPHLRGNPIAALMSAGPAIEGFSPHILARQSKSRIEQVFLLNAK